VTIRPAGKMAGEGWVTDAHSRKVQRSFSGNGADEDIVVASVRAYVTSLNKMISWLGTFNKGLKEAAAAEGGRRRAALGSQDQIAVAVKA
jgi:2-isopropylmalate synthase